MTQWVYSFGGGVADGRSEMRELLGGKGANLAEMACLGLPVPPGFTITTDVCKHFYDNGLTYPPELASAVKMALGKIESETGRQFGNPARPLLVSIRSGARVSMPGMMDTVLNLGLNDDTVIGLAIESGSDRFAWDSYRRFIQMYADVVMGVDHSLFEEQIELRKEEKGIYLDSDLDAEDWEALAKAFKQIVANELAEPFPEDPEAQLWGAVGAVFQSWQTKRAVTYRRLHDISEAWGTAVNVQAMVFGNMSDTSATGVAFTRDPSTGEKMFYGEFLVNAQGEDVVAGIRTPQSLTIKGREAQESRLLSMEEAMPEVFSQLLEVQARLEQHYRDMQDIEFTVERGRLWMLQTRSGKRTAKAAIRIAVEMAKENLITEDEAVLRIDPASLDQLLHPMLDPDSERTLLARGLPASPGAVSGQVCFSADEAEGLSQVGVDVILVRIETSPEDIHGMHAARGILTSRGGMTSHAAVVARGMGRPCVAGAGDVRVDYAKGIFQSGGHEVKKGDIVTLDGGQGHIYLGAVPTLKPELSDEFDELMSWADRARSLNVRANAETPADAETARGFGAEGIGLCRTEHMFFETERIIAVREMIMADNVSGREAALAKLLPMQRQDFHALFEIMSGLPVTIRLLDPPLHEFLPHTEDEMAEIARVTGKSIGQIRDRAAQLTEANPMLGHRGCRLAITYPEIYVMQARAIFEAASQLVSETGNAIIPEIMIPLVATKEETIQIRTLIDKVAVAIKEETGQEITYLVGTMIELPRAALRAGDIAEAADFFSFGTNDLTQTTFGLSRDDAASFLESYLRQGVLQKDPFVSLDQDGVGELIEIATERGRKTRPDIKLGICGEHGGDPASVEFCHRAGLDYVSCSPYRAPIARLAAGQAAIRARPAIT